MSAPFESGTLIAFVPPDFKPKSEFKSRLLEFISPEIIPKSDFKSRALTLSESEIDRGTFEAADTKSLINCLISVGSLTLSKSEIDRGTFEAADTKSLINCLISVGSPISADAEKDVEGKVGVEEDGAEVEIEVVEVEDDK
jgi:hypothetical protein